MVTLESLRIQNRTIGENGRAKRMSKHITVTGLFCEYKIYVCVYCANTYNWAYLQEAGDTLDFYVSCVSVSEQ